MQGYIDADEAAKFLEYTPARIRALAREGKLPCIKRGRAWFFKPEELLMNFKSAEGSQPLEKQK